MFGKRIYEFRERDILHKSSGTYASQKPSCRAVGKRRYRKKSVNECIKYPLYLAIAVAILKGDVAWQQRNGDWRKWRTYQHPVAFRLRTTEVWYAYLDKSDKFDISNTFLVFWLKISSFWWVNVFSTQSYSDLLQVSHYRTVLHFLDFGVF